MSSTATINTVSNVNPNPDPEADPRLQELKRFDESKTGVKGLVDRGLTTIPSIFVHSKPPERVSNSATRSPNRPEWISRNGSKPSTTIPTIDFSSPRSTIVDQVRQASTDLGFFQIINHGVPVQSITNILSSIQSFHEQPEEIKMQFYRRDPTHGIAYSSNFDLYNSKAASWRDTLQARLSPSPPEWDYVPEVCKAPLQEWDEMVQKIGAELMEVLCEGLGIESGRLRDLSCLDARTMAAHYYPYCPQPDLTAGLTSHTDPGVLTVLVENEVPGLQVKVGEEWVDVDPVDGAIVVNIGDVLQILSNDAYKSVEHRVLANPYPEPRVSAAVFFNPSQRDDFYGPLPELVSPTNPARYREFSLHDYMRRFFTKELDGKTLTNYYRV